MRTHETRTEGVLDCTGALTVLATKLTAVAYNYQDGLTLLEEKDEGAQAKDEKERKGLTEEQRRREERMERSRLERRKAALVTMPSVVQVMGYLFCLGLHMTGPFFEFTTYDHWTQRQGVRSFRVATFPVYPPLHWSPFLTFTLKQPSVLQPSFPSSPRASPLCTFPPIPVLPHHLQIWSAGVKQPPILPPFCRAFIQGVLSALVFLLVSPSLDLTRISDRHKNRAYPFHRRWLLAYHACIVWRFRAYILWSITEAAMITAGLGFSGWETPTGDPGKAGDVKLNGGELEGARGNGKGGEDGDVGKQEGDRTCAAPAGEGKALWSRARNVDILGVEFPKSCLDFATKWNISYGLWLRLYVYERMVPPGRKPTFFHMLATMFVSAVSHGLNWGDFIFFANWRLLLPALKLTVGIPKGTSTHRIVALLHTLYSIFVCTYMASAFCVMTLSAHPLLITPPPPFSPSQPPLLPLHLPPCSPSFPLLLLLTSPTAPLHFPSCSFSLPPLLPFISPPAPSHFPHCSPSFPLLLLLISPLAPLISPPPPSHFPPCSSHLSPSSLSFPPLLLSSLPLSLSFPPLLLSSLPLLPLISPLAPLISPPPPSHFPPCSSHLSPSSLSFPPLLLSSLPLLPLISPLAPLISPPPPSHFPPLPPLISPPPPSHFPSILPSTLSHRHALISHPPSFQGHLTSHEIPLAPSVPAHTAAAAAFAGAASAATPSVPSFEQRQVHGQQQLNQERVDPAAVSQPSALMSAQAAGDAACRVSHAGCTLSKQPCQQWTGERAGCEAR
ncbi:unnamed protein product [Closterium sp. Naga37s-1]|nr:unnamed protein product [Closterium sp. Naga37s-1]